MKKAIRIKHSFINSRMESEYIAFAYEILVPIKKRSYKNMKEKDQAANSNIQRYATGA